MPSAYLKELLIPLTLDHPMNKEKFPLFFFLVRGKKKKPANPKLGGA